MLSPLTPDQLPSVKETRKRIADQIETLLDGKLSVSVARMKLQTAIAVEERRNSAAVLNGPEPESVRSARLELEEAEENLRAFPARPISPFELPELLDKATSSAESLLIISSRRLDRSVIDGAFLKRLEEFLKNGCDS